MNANTQALHDARDVLTNLIAAQQTPAIPIQSNLAEVLAQVRAAHGPGPGPVVLRIVDEETARTVTTVAAARLRDWLTVAATADHGPGIHPTVLRFAASVLGEASPTEVPPPAEVLMQRLTATVRRLRAENETLSTTLADIANLAGGTD